MNAQEFKDTRHRLGLTQEQMGKVLGLKQAARNVQFYEAGRNISGTVQVALRYIVRHGLDGAAKRAAGLK